MNLFTSLIGWHSAAPSRAGTFTPRFQFGWNTSGRNGLLALTIAL